MNLKKYLKKLTPEAKEGLADRCNTSVAYLEQLAYGHRKAGHELAKRIESESGGNVTRYDMRPDIFGDVPKVDAA